jgi:hypothetical protein
MYLQVSLRYPRNTVAELILVLCTTLMIRHNGPIFPTHAPNCFFHETSRP